MLTGVMGHTQWRLSVPRVEPRGVNYLAGSMGQYMYNESRLFEFTSISFTLNFHVLATSLGATCHLSFVYTFWVSRLSFAGGLITSFESLGGPYPYA